MASSAKNRGAASVGASKSVDTAGVDRHITSDATGTMTSDAYFTENW